MKRYGIGNTRQVAAFAQVHAACKPDNAASIRLPGQRSQ
jgi:hypothetical protein